jgi:hypothetical protein
MKRLMLALAALLLIVMATGWFVIWRSPPYYIVGSNGTHLPENWPPNDESTLAAGFEEPYIVLRNMEAGALLLFGARHTQDPTDPQIAEISRRWSAFQPTVALVEGRLGFLVPIWMDPVEAFGEGGQVYALARREQVPTYSWEQPLEQEVAQTLETFSAEQTALFYVLRPYFGSLRFGKPDDPEGFVQPYLEARTSIPGLVGTLSSVADIDRIWQRDFSGEPDWREISDEWGLPGYLGELAAHTNMLRDEHFALVILDLASQGERVFAVAGSSHAWRLDGWLNKTGTFDTPGKIK